MTIALYARRKGWPLAGVTVRLRRSRIREPDHTVAQAKPGRRDRIEQEITVTGELTEEQRTKLLSIADRCPVHRTLLSEIPIRTILG
jgi:putative redox protein